jgi:endonuclease-3 related protein
MRDTRAFKIKSMPSKSTRRNSAPDSLANRRLRRMYNHLVSRYGPQQWWPAQSPFEVVIGAYLTQNTAWKSVERSIANLEARGILSIAGLRDIPEDELRQLIRPSGFMIRKAAALKAFVAFLDAHYHGQIEALQHAARENPAAIREQLLDLPNIGPETADAILLYALNAPAMVVDEYLRRITTRHGLVPASAKYAEIQSLAEQAFAQERASESPVQLARHYNEFHALMVQIGKLHCGRTPRCEGCLLAFDLAKHNPAALPHKLKA